MAAAAAAEGIHNPITDGARAMFDPQREYMDHELLKALQSGDRRTVERFFPQEVSMAIDPCHVTNIADQAGRRSCPGFTVGGNSALHIAADFGHLELAELICTRDSFLLTVRNVAGETPLHCAARAGADRIVSLFISRARRWEYGRRLLEALLRAKDREGKTALHAAAQEGSAAVAEVLMSEDPELAAIDDDNGVSPLYAAVLSRSLGIVKILIGSRDTTDAAADNGVSTLCTNVSSLFTGPTPPTLAMPAPAEPEISALRRVPRMHGDPIGSRADKGDTPDASHAGPNGQTALHAAAMIENPEIAEKLLQWKPILIKKVDSSRSTPLHYLATTSNRCMMRLLLKHDTSPAYFPDSQGLCPIHIAASMERPTIISELINSCPDMYELVDSGGRNFLHVAIQHKREKIVRFVCRQPLLLKMMNARDSEGNTPLHLAVESKNQTVVSLLLENMSVHPSIVNKNGKTPLDLAMAGVDAGLNLQQNPSLWIYQCLVRIEAIYGLHRLDRSVHEKITKLEEEKDGRHFKNFNMSNTTCTPPIPSAYFPTTSSNPSSYSHPKWI